MRKSLSRSIMVLGAAACLMGGCAGKDPSGNSQKNVSNGDAKQLDASRSKFESSEDPPFNADTHFAAGQLSESQGQPEAALEHYRAAVKINPKHEAALFRIGSLCSQLKQYPQAIEAWKQYVKVTGGNATAYSNLGFCLELSGKGVEAEAAYKSGIKKNPKSEPCRVNYGLFLARVGRPKEAIDQLSAVLPPAQVHYDLASVYEQVGRSAEARAEYHKALDLDPEFWEAKARLAKIE